jgi:hypothetical protein
MKGSGQREMQMSGQENKTKDKPVTRRDVLKSVGKYSAAATGATVVALSANQALAQASSSNEWVCTDYYPWWICWWFGFQSANSNGGFGGWNGFNNNAEPDYLGDTNNPG